MAPTEYRGQGDVARWCQLASASVISNWLRRRDDWPEPDAVIMNEDSSFPVRGWLASRQPEWIAYAAERGKHVGPGPTAAAAARRNRRAADMIYRDMEASRIDAVTAARLLHELI